MKPCQTENQCGSGGVPPGSFRAPGLISRALAMPFVALIWVYRVTLSPWIGGQCRFEPSCSRYALDAYRQYGVWRGTRLTVSRVLRCHPFNKGGYDPVPFPDSGEDREGAQQEQE